MLVGEPIRAAVLLMILAFVAGLVGAILAGLGNAVIAPGTRPADWVVVTATEAATAVFIAGLITRSRWWGRVLGRGEVREVSLPTWVLAGLPAVLGGLVDLLTAGRVRPVTPTIGLELSLEFSAAAIAEELLFRGLIFAALRPRGLGSAVALSAVLFGLFHVPNALAFPLPAVVCQVVFATGAGALWAVVRLRSDLVAPVIFAHFIADLARYVLGYSLNDVAAISLVAQVALGLALGSIAWATVVLGRGRREIAVLS